MVVTVVDADFVIIILLIVIDDHRAHQLPHGHLLEGREGKIRLQLHLPISPFALWLK